MDKAGAFQKCLDQVKFHVETDQSRALLAKERREGWEFFYSLFLSQWQLLRHLHRTGFENHWRRDCFRRERVRKNLSERMAFELRSQKISRRRPFFLARVQGVWGSR